jgi:nitrogen fixation/metabolism regulation signal transduction histidine kinase
MRALLYRHLQIAFALFVLLLLVALGMLAGLGWRNQQRLDMIGRSVEHTHALQRAGLDMRHLQVADLTGLVPLREESLNDVGHTIAPLAQPGVLLVPDNARRLQQVEGLLDGWDAPPRERLAAALELLRQTSYAEIDSVSRMLATAAQDAATESSVSVAALVVLPALLSMAVWLLLRRIFKPIDNLTDLLLRLGEGDPSPVPVRRVDPLLLPLLNNYNAMIARLAELEEARRAYAESLQGEVRAATQALLEQHQSLARAERLAAAGEVAASVAHELRNPLAGIQMALTNLRHDLDDAAAVERLDLVVAELDRISRLLKGLLDQVRSAPEPPQDLSLAGLVEELLALVRYQAPAQVAIRANVAEGLRCLLPDNHLRQALLNLVLNAIHALEGRSGEIVIAATTAEATLRLSVCDDGPGFPAEILGERVQVFRTGRSSGTGLGLAMVHRFARDLGGRLELSNREPHGACAALVLPCGVP